jgi:hypothetical protein
MALITLMALMAGRRLRDSVQAVELRPIVSAISDISVICVCFWIERRRLLTAE